MNLPVTHISSGNRNRIRKKSYRSFFVLTVLLVFMFNMSCDDCQDNNSGTSGVILPLKIGNKWEFKTDNGAVNSWEVVGSAVIRGDLVAVVQIRDDDDNFWNFYFKNKSDGLYGYGWEGAEFDPYLIYKYPASPGDTYTYFGQTVRVAQIDTAVTVQAGTFTCYRYIFDDYGSDLFSPNIGQIKEEDPDYTNELIRYTVTGSEY